MPLQGKEKREAVSTQNLHICSHRSLFRHFTLFTEVKSSTKRKIIPVTYKRRDIEGQSPEAAA